MASLPSTVSVLAMGGTIAGSAARASDNVGYVAAQRGVDDLVAAVPALAGQPLRTRQVAQVDSKDMSVALWGALVAAVAEELARPEVCGVVITHGTDTLEETAYLLHRFVAADKPVVLTAAMRPATSLAADGPQNLFDAVCVAREPGARGVVAALGGRVIAGHALRKLHPYRVDAFGGGDGGPLAVVRDGRVQAYAPWPVPAVPVATWRDAPWPWVEIVSSHGGADGRAVRALVDAGVRGLVVAGTGNASVHAEVLQALEDAQRRGVVVLRGTRCTAGEGVADGRLPEAVLDLTPAQARLALTLRLLDAPAP